MDFQWICNKRVDELVKRDLTCDWEWLRGESCKINHEKFYYPLLVNVVCCYKCNSGIEPVLITQLNKTGIKMVVPSVKSLGNKYTH
jgi:hypothetical protein